MSTIQLYGKLASKFFSCVFRTVVGSGLDWKLTVYFQELFFFFFPSQWHCLSLFIFKQCLESFFRHLCVQFRTQSSTSCSWKGDTCRHPLSSLSLLYPSAGTERVGNAQLHSLKPSLLFWCKITRAHISVLKLTMNNATSQMSWGNHCYPLLHSSAGAACPQEVRLLASFSAGCLSVLPTSRTLHSLRSHFLMSCSWMVVRSTQRGLPHRIKRYQS